MIPNDPNIIEKMKALAERNIANGDWGDEVTIFGLPGETLLETRNFHPSSKFIRKEERL
jgi:hypothetical protein